MLESQVNNGKAHISILPVSFMAGCVGDSDVFVPG